MVEYDLFTYEGQPYCHWWDNAEGHMVNFLEKGEDLFWHSYPCVGKDKDNVMQGREHWVMLLAFHNLAWRYFGVGYDLVFKSERCNNPYVIDHHTFKTIFHKALSAHYGSIYVDHLGQFQNYEGVIHFDKVESRDKVVFWLDGFTAEVVKDMLS